MAESLDANNYPGLLRHTGLSQVAGVRLAELCEGPERGIHGGLPVRD
jgi:hypothetical protein